MEYKIFITDAQLLKGINRAVVVSGGLVVYNDTEPRGLFIAVLPFPEFKGESVKSVR